MLTRDRKCGIIILASNAAIAQSVERILGKDEVTSSNLVSSLTANPIVKGFAVFCFLRLFRDLKY